MKKNNTIMDIMQTFLTPKEVETVCNLIRYKDTSRKFTVYTLLQYFVAAAVGEWKSFRQSTEKLSDFELPQVDHSTISKKASTVDYEITKRLFHILSNKCNRSVKRILDLPKDLLAIDSTTITVGKNRIPWAKYKG
ncbi:MAG: IS4 family transposase, partial [Vallitalea sp.]|nr:IS4 family transposase [Vallitalea sp.]